MSDDFPCCSPKPARTAQPQPLHIRNDEPSGLIVWIFVGAAAWAVIAAGVIAFILGVS